MSTTRGAAPETAIRLEVGQRLPTVEARRVGGGRITLPTDVEDRWAVVLLYRGHWCPYCRQQLDDFQKRLDRFREEEVDVLALSADPESEARSTVEGHGIGFPVGYGLDPVRAREELGVYVGGHEQPFVQAAGFVLRPGGTVELAVYSSGAVGRLVATDVLGLIRYLRSQG